MIEEINTTQQKLSYTKQDVIETPLSMKAIVTNITVKKAKEIFVNKEGVIKTDKPEDDFLCLTVENAEHCLTKEYHVKKYDKVPDGSNLGKIITRYNGLDVGITVLLAKNGDGHYDLVM